jgi:NCS1 family nucleobase:cation symporter-1
MKSIAVIRKIKKIKREKIGVVDMALIKKQNSSAFYVDTSHIPKGDRPVSKHNLHGKGRFFGLFAGEHVAGTEFVIGATFVMWGVAAYDVVIGLIFGNLLAVLTWALLTAPIATDTRLTMYSYLKKISGPSMQKVYNGVNGIFFCILGGAMVTVSASAVRELLNIPIQTNWYPTSVSFVVLVLIIGSIVALVAAFGFSTVTRFSSICAPWLALVFISGALVGLPQLVSLTSGISSIGAFSDFMTLADQSIWVSSPESQYTIWHVIAFAWIANLAVHGGMSDMAIFRYAKSPKYGYISAVGMFFGHYIAWICAGIMGAAAALLLSTTLTQLDPGAVSYSILGATGIIAVIIAGWTTSNPTLYRAGLAFQTIFGKYSVKTVTLATGFLITIIACFPFAFTNLLDVLAFMAHLLLPVGAIIVTEHWIFPKLGYTRYWATYKGLQLNRPALYSWIAGALFFVVMNFVGVIHLFFLAVPTWLVTSIVYIFLAGKAGAKEMYTEAEEKDRLIQEKVIEEQDEEALEELKKQPVKAERRSPLSHISGLIAFLSIGTLLVSSIMVFFGSMNIDAFKSVSFSATIVYFITATYWAKG